MTPLPIYIGYDPAEAIAYHVLCHSILRRATGPVSITPLIRNALTRHHRRSRGPLDSTEFTYTRFLTPYLAHTPGYSIFMDCDFLCLTDIYDLIEAVEKQPPADVCVVQHDYTPTTTTKFLNQPQTTYPCKNWSSLMVFNGYRMACRALTPEYIDVASGMDLHRFKWAKKVGSLPLEWNHLVGEYAPNPNAKLVHYTIGGPYFTPYKDCEYATEWFNELEHMLSTCQTAQLNCNAKAS